MIDVNFWNLVAAKWISVLDKEELDRIRDDAKDIAKKTIGKDNKKLLDVFSALKDYL